MNKQISIELPLKTVSELNVREHWAVKRKRRLAQQTEVDAELYRAMNGERNLLPCTVTLTRIGPKSLDTDNLASAFKATRDAVAKRLGVDDGDPRIKFEYDQIPIGIHEYRVRIEIVSHG